MSDEDWIGMCGLQARKSLLPTSRRCSMAPCYMLVLLHAQYVGIAPHTPSPCLPAHAFMPRKSVLPSSISRGVGATTSQSLSLCHSRSCHPSACRCAVCALLSSICWVNLRYSAGHKGHTTGRQFAARGARRASRSLQLAALAAPRPPCSSPRLAFATHGRPCRTG